MHRAKLFSLLLTAFCTVLVGLEEGVLVAAGVPFVFAGALWSISIRVQAREAD
jgi:MFS superfamily sulfate permease-like transporter